MTYQYTYDKMDNIVTKNTEHGNYAYGYDELYRLIDVDNPTPNDEIFTYDPVGNRLTSDGVEGDWSHNGNNELLGYDDTSFEYDDNGNMVQETDNGVITNYIYNEEDRLSEIRDGSGSLIASYYYDPFGRRLWKDVDGTRTYFLYSDEGLIGEYDSSGSEIKTYGYAPGSTWMTDPLFMKEGDNYYFYQNDHLGTPQKITSSNGAVVWTATYTSFGEAKVNLASTITNNLRYPGQFYDQETGLHYNYHRYYAPETGRYLRSDPLIDALKIKSAYKSIGHKIFIFYPEHFHLYAYSRNNPISQTDIYGLFSTCPKGQHREYDSAGFFKCFLGNPETVVICGVCIGAGVSGTGSGFAVAACAACLMRELYCTSQNTKCVCD